MSDKTVGDVEAAIQWPEIEELKEQLSTPSGKRITGSHTEVWINADLLWRILDAISAGKASFVRDTPNPEGLGDAIFAIAHWLRCYSADNLMKARVSKLLTAYRSLQSQSAPVVELMVEEFEDCLERDIENYPEVDTRKTVASINAIIRSKSGAGAGDEDNLTCPLCHDTGFDAIGLKSHYTLGRCDVWETTMTIAEERAARA